MDEVTPFQFWIRRGTYLAFGILLLLQAIIPQSLEATQIPGPDIFYCITMAYIIRRPEYAPLWAIVLIFFLRDVVTMAPLGLATLFFLIATEIVRANLQAFREYFFGIEWLWVAVIYGLILVTQNLVLSLSVSFTPKFVDLFYQFFFTTLAYPVIVLIMRYLFAIDRPAAGKTDARGHRI